MVFQPLFFSLLPFGSSLQYLFSNWKAFLFSISTSRTLFLFFLLHSGFRQEQFLGCKDVCILFMSFPGLHHSGLIKPVPKEDLCQNSSQAYQITIKGQIVFKLINQMAFNKLCSFVSLVVMHAYYIRDGIMVKLYFICQIKVAATGN